MAIRVTMKTKLTQFIPATIVLAGIAFAPISYWCMYSNGVCYGTWVSHIYQYFTSPIYSFSLFLLPIALIIAFVPRHIFSSWLKLVAWALPPAFIFIALTTVNWMGIGLNLFPFYRDDAARLAGQIFSGMSIILIIWKYMVARHRSPKAPSY